MSLPDVDTSYEPYADDPIYVAVNQALVDTIDLQDIERVADLACGTGLLTGLLFERKPAVAVCDIDLDPQQIEIARRKLGARRRIVTVICRNGGRMASERCICASVTPSSSRSPTARSTS